MSEAPCHHRFIVSFNVRYPGSNSDLCPSCPQQRDAQQPKRGPSRCPLTEDSGVCTRDRVVFSLKKDGRSDTRYTRGDPGGHVRGDMHQAQRDSCCVIHLWEVPGGATPTETERRAGAGVWGRGGGMSV